MTKKINPITLSRTSQAKLAEFDEAAKVHGWESDQGTGAAVTEAEARYKEAKKQLEKHIRRLEGLVRAAKRKDAEAASARRPFIGRPGEDFHE